MVQNNFVWKSGNEEIDDFIQEMQLKIKDNNSNIFEWIPYNQFNEIKEIGKSSSITAYSAIWRDGPLYWNTWNNEYARDLNKKVALKCLHSSQNPIEFLINEV